MSSTKEAKAAFKQATAWGAPVLLADSDAILFLKEKVTRSREHLPDDSAGQPFHAASDQGLITCGGDLTCYLRYHGLETMLAMALGLAGTPTLSGTSTYSHALRMADMIDGLFGTLGLYKGFSAHEYASVKVDGFTITGEAGQPITIAFHTIADDLSVNSTSGLNTAASMAAIALPSPMNRVLFRQGVFLINDVSDGALSANDGISPSKFSLAFKRKLTGDHLAGSDRIAEPSAAAFPDITLELTFPSYTSDTYLHDLGDDIHKKMKIAFTGGQIEAGHNFGLEILLPHLVITNAEAMVDKAGKITHPVTMSVLAAPSAPAGMSGVTQPLAVNLVNTRGSDPLA